MEVARQYLEAAGISGGQSLLSAEYVQGRAALAAGFGKHQGTVGKVERREGIAACQLRARRAPVQPSRDHQVKDQPQTVVESNRDALADPPQVTNDMALHLGDGRFRSPEQECIQQTNMPEWLAD